MIQDKILDLASKSYYTATLNCLNLNLPDLKRIEKTIMEGFPQVALQDLQRTISLMERDIKTQKEKIEKLK